MHTIKSEFRAVSPFYHRRWGGKFTNRKLRPRLRKAWRPRFGYEKPHGQGA